MRERGSGSSSAPRERRRECGPGSGELDPLVEGDLALERAVDRALGGDHLQPLDLLVG